MAAAPRQAARRGPRAFGIECGALMEMGAATAPAAPGPGAASDRDRTLRNVGEVVAQRGLHILAAALFAAFVPRLMGPDRFGRFALLLSVSLWFALLSGFGAVSVMSRAVPRLLAEGQTHAVRRLTTSLMALRALTGPLAAAGCFAVLAFVLREPDRVASALVALAVVGRTINNVAFSLFLGLNDAGRWGRGELLRRWLTLALAPAGFVAGGLRGACAGVAAAEAVVLGLGLWWVRAYIGRDALDLSRRYLSPFLRAGSGFGVAAVLAAITQRSGEVIVRLATGRYEEVGYLGAAYSIYLTVAFVLWHATFACLPFIVGLLGQGRRAEVSAWLERLLTYGAIAAAICVAGAVVAGPVAVPWVLGRSYAPVAASLVPLMVAMLFHAAGDVGRLLALAVDPPRIVTAAAALELAAFWGIGLPLAARAGSVGAAMAAVAAAALYAAFLTRHARRSVRYSLAAAGRAVALAVVFVPPALARGAWPLNAVLLAAALVAYAVLLVSCRVVTAGELAEVRRLLLGRAAARR